MSVYVDGCGSVYVWVRVGVCVSVHMWVSVPIFCVRPNLAVEILAIV